MAKENSLSIEDCSTYYKIETTFIKDLGEYGLVKIIHRNQQSFIPHDQLNELERYMHLHYDLDINMEGLEAISHLLERMKNLQSELMSLKNRLSSYE